VLFHISYLFVRLPNNTEIAVVRSSSLAVTLKIYVSNRYTCHKTMTTPGRTHIPWQTQDGQIQELVSYIGFLEAKVQYLQQHHDQCLLWNIASIPNGMDVDLSYLPPDQTISADDFIIPNNIITQPSETNYFQTITPAISPQQSPEPIPPQITQKIIRGNPRWKRIIDLMIKDWDKPQSWAIRRISLGLDTVESNNSALTIILGLNNSLSHTTFRSSTYLTNHNSSTSSSETASSTSEALINSARQYAIDTKSTSASAGLLVQIHNFRELVFVSLCVVMEAHGLPIPTINDLMRICMSSSGAANLYRLRRGALWVNRVIRGMMKRGWGHAATELFLLCQYYSPDSFFIWQKMSKS
jgi:hypothetical protein